MLDVVHVHLFINHVPFLGITAGLIILVVALMKNSEEMKKLSLGFLVVSSLFLIPTYFSGENTEERVEHLPGVSESIIEKHDDAAKSSMVLGGLLGALALLAVFLKDKKQKATLTGILIVGLLAEASIANTAKLGGQIRHTEVRDGASTAGGEDGEDKESKEGKGDKESKASKSDEDKKEEPSMSPEKKGSVAPKKLNAEANENEENEKKENKN